MMDLNESSGYVTREGKKQKFYDAYEVRYTTGNIFCSVNWVADLSVVSNTELVSGCTLTRQRLRVQ